MLGDFLYSLTDAEAASAPVVQRYAELVVPVGVAAVTVSAVGARVPGEKIIRVTNICVTGSGGGAQTVITLGVWIADEAGNLVATVIRMSPLVNGGAGLTGWQHQCDFLLMPGERLESSVQFSAGAAVNNMSLNVLGYMLPRGTVQRR